MLVFWEKGYPETSLSDLERATGLGRQSLYGAFGDKRELFAKAVERYFTRVLEPIVDLLDEPGSPRANIERLLQNWEDYACSALFRGCLVDRTLDSAPSDPHMNEFFSRKLAYLEAALERTLRRAQTAGEVPTSLDTKATARALLALSQGLSSVARVRREREYVRSVLAAARQLLT